MEYTYYREAGRLLAEDHAGHHVLIKGKEIIGLWGPARLVQEFLELAFLVHQVQEREPVLRNPLVD